MRGATADVEAYQSKSYDYDHLEHLEVEHYRWMTTTEQEWQRQPDALKKC